MAAPGCYDSSDQPTAYTRSRISAADAPHDFLDESRIKEIIEKSEASEGYTLTDKQKDIFKKFRENVIDLIKPIRDCGINLEITDENKLMEAFYGEDHLAPPGTQILSHPSFNNKFPLIPPPPPPPKLYNVRFQYKYHELPQLATVMKNKLFSGYQYVLDHTALRENEFFCDHISSPGGIPPLLETIGKSYDRVEPIRESDKSCREKVVNPFTPGTTLPRTVLTKENGELFYFDSISIVNENTLKWNKGTHEGNINIREMISQKSHLPEQLSAIIIQLCLIINTNPTITIDNSQFHDFKEKLNKFFKDAYHFAPPDQSEDGVTAAANIRDYALGLMEFKRIGDLLQVKLAYIKRNAVFVSNDRMAVLMAAVGYKIPAIRTYAFRKERYISLYNVPSSEGIAKALNEQLIANYKSSLELYKLLRPAPVFDDDALKLNHIISAYYDSIKGQSTVIAYTSPRYRDYMNMDVLINRAIYIILRYLLFLHTAIDFISKKNGVLSSIEEKSDLKYYQELFKSHILPEPNTIFILGKDGKDHEHSLTKLYYILKEITKIIPKPEEDIKTRQHLLNTMIYNIEKTKLPLFGNNLNTYITNINSILQVRPIGTRIEGLPENTIVGRLLNLSTIIHNLNEFEIYVDDLCSKYDYLCPVIRGGSKSKSRKNRKQQGGQLLYPIQLPHDYVAILSNYLLVYIIHYSNSDGSLVFNEYFVMYIQLQFLSQQYGYNVILFQNIETSSSLWRGVRGVATSTAVAASTAAAKAMAMATVAREAATRAWAAWREAKAASPSEEEAALPAEAKDALNYLDDYYANHQNNDKLIDYLLEKYTDFLKEYEKYLNEQQKTNIYAKIASLKQRKQLSSLESSPPPLPPPTPVHLSHIPYSYLRGAAKKQKSKKEDKKKDKEKEDKPVKGGKSKKEMKENAKTKKTTKSDKKK